MEIFERPRVKYRSMVYDIDVEGKEEGGAARIDMYNSHKSTAHACTWRHLRNLSKAAGSLFKDCLLIGFVILMS